MHTERTHTEQNTRYNNMQHTEQDNTEQTQHSTQPQHRCITYDLHKYNFDIYHEYVCIKNSNTIELYTISND